MLFLATLLLSVGVATAQTRQVTGLVVTADHGEPVSGAMITVRGTNITAVTGSDGTFVLQAVPNTARVITVSCLGMKKQDTQVKDFVHVLLEYSESALDEAMVVAYGTTTRNTFTGSASVVKSENIENRQVADISKAMAGAVAGVQTLSSNGQPGTSATVRIRGIGSINAGTAPLYVVDGVPLITDLSSVNPQDIESYTVLKDAAAAALYGARGANGVILITTRKGKPGTPKITFDASWGSNSRQIKNYNVLTSPAEYMERLYQAGFNNEYFNNSGSLASAHTQGNLYTQATGFPIYTIPSGETLIGLDGKINPNATLGYSDGLRYYTPDDWQKGTFSNELRQEYNLSISGASGDLNYYFNAGYLEDNGVIAHSGFDRISTRLNLDYRVRSWLRLSTNLAYTNSKSKYPREQDGSSSSVNAFYVANNIAPVYPMYVRNADGTLLYDQGNVVYDYGIGASQGYQFSTRDRNWMSMANPIGDLKNTTREFLMDIFDGKWAVELTPLEGLTLTARLGLSIDNTRYHYASSKRYGQSSNYGGEATQEQTRAYQFMQQYMADYKFNLGKNSFDVLAAYETSKLETEGVWANGQNLYRAGVWVVSNTIDQRDGGGSYTEYALRSFIGRVNYDFDKKYFASFSFRRDGSSRFAKHNRWGNFWSLSAAWEINKENFMRATERWLDMLKLKASFGQQGNDDIRNYYAYTDQYELSGANGTFSDGVLIYKGNPDLTWEKSNSFNIGFDFSLFKGFFYGSIEYFSRQTQDMLYYKPVSNINGYSSIPMNIGSMRNSGLELDFNFQFIDTKDFRWTAAMNATFLKNKVIELAPDLNGELIDGSRIFREGESMYQLYLVKYAGVDRTTGLALYWAKDEDGNEYATSDWTTARQTNRQSTGDLLADVYGGLSTSIFYKGFDFSIATSFQLGGKIYDSGYQRLMHAGSVSDVGSNWHEDIRNAWTLTNTNTDIPRLDSGDEMGWQNAQSDRWLISSDYFAINNITLGYTLPASLIKPLRMSSVRVYFSAENVAIFTARKGVDPRTSFTSTDMAIYSPLRTLTGGIKVSF
ncbi:MAG: SusC/RagA family TonB-linked outer membrane protein [Bacteroidaceae bacterium]|nr:SusC/RagA family TonB-linked outer membrane protein [Bacteroidaceae bacterium]